MWPAWPSERPLRHRQRRRHRERPRDEVEEENPVMARFNVEFWEIPTSAAYLDGIPAERALWFETAEDRERRYALQDFFQSVLPVVQELIDAQLTERQKEVLKLYYFCNKTQEDIAEMLGLTQSTVSRHLFGTARNGKKVGGAVAKLQKAVEKCAGSEVDQALAALKIRFDTSSAAA
ncbi:MAG: sigma-70 family RNA polymerase sigma factor [Candidatus Hydrogenedentales bacterium]